MTNQIKVEFAPGCFDNFEGTQEELDSLINTINELAQSGKLFEETNIINLDELTEEEEEQLQIVSSAPRRLH